MLSIYFVLTGFAYLSSFIYDFTAHHTSVNGKIHFTHTLFFLYQKTLVLCIAEDKTKTSWFS